MKKNYIKKITIVGVLATILATSALGCGKNSKAAERKKNKDGVTKLVIGSGINYKPYCYLDENNKAVGYEYDVLEEVDKLLPQYEFEYKSMAFDQLVLSLESKKIDVAAHQYEFTPEREKKYLFGKEPYTSYITYLAVPLESKVESLEDLAGKKVRTGGATSATTQILTKWNQEHKGKEVELVTSESSSDEEGAAALKSGAAAASVLKKSDVIKLNKNFSDNGKEWVKSVGKPINDSKTYYLYRKNDEKIRDDIDGALKTLKKNGTLSKLAIKWVGYDVTEEE